MLRRLEALGLGVKVAKPLSERPRGARQKHEEAAQWSLNSMSAYGDSNLARKLSILLDVVFKVGKQVIRLYITPRRVRRYRVEVCMLGRLLIDLKQAILVFAKLLQVIFSDKKIGKSGAFKASKLEAALILRDAAGNESERMIDVQPGTDDYKCRFYPELWIHRTIPHEHRITCGEQIVGQHKSIKPDV
jgi:hypothetical protein